MNAYIELSYLVAAVLFAVSLKLLASPRTARNGNFLAIAAMVIAIAATLGYLGVASRIPGAAPISWPYVIFGAVVGIVIGVIMAIRVQMTEMPEMVALFNGFGGLASLCVALSEYFGEHGAFTQQSADILLVAISASLSALIGAVTFTGSLAAWGKLNGKLSSNPIVFPYQKTANALLMLGLLALCVLFALEPSWWTLALLTIGALILGILAVIPIGGADMPVVIALMNSYSGLAASATGFVLNNRLLIVAGALVGASGIILTQIMCKAMNRSLANVLFSAFGTVDTAAQAETVKRTVRRYTAEDAAIALDAANKVVIVPGYGMAVSQAQHIVRELDDLLTSRGKEVLYAIHPVAGRMPGHMNVLLAEVNVPYEKLVEMETINPQFENTDVVLIIGANDVVNPAARNDPKSPIYGMPILDVDKARTVMVIKRSLSYGFAGIDNELFYYDKTMMLFGDAKGMANELVAELKKY
jgi:NAD(P) transhydrogenase subunit beta